MSVATTSHPNGIRVRLPDAMLRELRSLAEANDRSAHKEAIRAIKAHLDREGRGNGHSARNEAA